MKYSPTEHSFSFWYVNWFSTPAWHPCLIAKCFHISCHLRLYRQVHPRCSSSGGLYSYFRWGPSSGHYFRRRWGCYYQYQWQIYSIKYHMESPVCWTRVQTGTGGFYWTTEIQVQSCETNASDIKFSIRFVAVRMCGAMVLFLKWLRIWRVHWTSGGCTWYGRVLTGKRLLLYSVGCTPLAFPFLSCYAYAPAFARSELDWGPGGAFRCKSQWS